MKTIILKILFLLTFGATQIAAQSKKPFTVSAAVTRASRFERKIERSQFFVSLILTVPLAKRVSFVASFGQPFDFNRPRVYATGVVFKIF